MIELNPIHMMYKRNGYKCLQRLPEQCRYCNRFIPNGKSFCRAASTARPIDMNSYKGQSCGSFIPRKEHCETCSMKIECITGV